MYIQRLMRALLFLFLTPAFAVEMPIPVIADATPFNLCTIEKKTPLSKKYLALAESCARQICKDDFGPDVKKSRRNVELNKHFRKSIEKWMKQNSSPEVFEWANSFETTMNFVALLPDQIKRKDYVDKLRASFLYYSDVLGVRDLALSEYLKQRTIVAGPLRAETTEYLTKMFNVIEKESSALDISALSWSPYLTWLPWISKLDDYTNLATVKVVISPAAINSSHFFAVGTHEIAHAIRMWAEQNQNDKILNAINKLKMALVSQNPLLSEKYSEEDWADYFSAKMTKENLACHWMSLLFSRKTLDLTPNDKDSHSAYFYRLLMIEKNQKGILPTTCEQAIQVRAIEYCSK